MEIDPDTDTDTGSCHYDDAAYVLEDVTDEWLAANHLSRAQWEEMVAKEAAKMRAREIARGAPPPPSQGDLFS